MRNITIRKVVQYVAGVLASVGLLLLFGSFVVWLIGLETITRFYAENKPLVFCAGAGAALIGLGILVSALAGGGHLTAAAPRAGAAPGGEFAEGIPCDKCRAINDVGAKFCDQCGAALPGR